MDHLATTRERVWRGVPRRVAAIPPLESINPTGGIFVDYDPQARTGPHGPGVTTLDKVHDSPPDEPVTIYRGAPRRQRQIVPGDFVTDSYQAAQDYASGGGHVLQMRVPKSHVATDPDEWEGGEHIYSPPRTSSLASRRVAATDQDYGLPPNMEFRLYDKPGMYGTNAAGVYYKNHPTGPNNWVSAITWRNGTIGNVETKPRHQGKGYASALHQWIKDNHEPNLQHSTALTDAGRGWAEKVGANNPQFTRHFSRAVQAVLDGMAQPTANHFIDAQYATRQALNAAQTGPEKDAGRSLADLVTRVASIYGIRIASRRVAAAHPPLPDLWNDYQNWHNEIHDNDPEYRPEHSVQSWGDVEEYLGDRHGIDPHDPKGLDHPAALGMAKLHSLAQARPQVDGFQGRDDYLLNDDDLTTGAALGLLRIRKNQLTQRLEPVQPRYRASREPRREAAFDPIKENFGPHYQPGKDKAIDNAANAYALWAGRLDDSNFDELSDNMVNAINAAGFGPHHDPYDAMMELQNHLRKAAVSIPYQRNNGGMRDVPGFGQEHEPWGRYVSPDAPRELPQGWERGQVDFENPLHVEHNDGAWKQQLSQAHGGLTGKDLSQALLAKGHDGVITHDQYGIGEIVDIRPKDQRGHRVAMPTYYHYTDDPNFSLKNQSPRDVEGGGDSAGLFVSPEGQGHFWPKQWGGDRSHMVELHSPHKLEDHPDVINRHHLHPDEEITPELFVPHGKGDLEVRGVHPYDEWDERGHRVAMPTYYHRSVNPLTEGHKPSYFYTADDPHDVDYETRAYGDQVYQTELPEDVMEADSAPRRTPGAAWWRTDPANVGEMTHIHDPTAPFGVPRRRP